MPYVSSKIRLPQELDRRRKLTEEQKEEIRHKYSTVTKDCQNSGIGYTDEKGSFHKLDFEDIILTQAD